MRENDKTVKKYLLALCVFLLIPILGKSEEKEYLRGNLPNGLTYYIHRVPSENKKVSFYLIEKSGSINEESYESGLAHFLEHMAFKGTRHFPGRSVVDYLQGKGIKFGPDLNAVTSFDKTIFRIENVPVTEGIIDSCLLILRDWGKDIWLNDDDIDSERAVIIQEALSTESLQKRIRQSLAHQLLPSGHPYIEKTPIGDTENVNNFPYVILKEYYEKWYRPDLQAVIVEGDINEGEVLEFIETLWSDVPKPIGENKFEMPQIPNEKNPQIAITQDSGIRQNTLDIQFYDPAFESYPAPYAYKTSQWIREMIAATMTKRLSEKVSDDSSPLRAANVSNSSFTPIASIPAFTVGAVFNGNRWKDAMDSIVYELKRFTESGISRNEFETMMGSLNQRLQYLQSVETDKSYLSSQFKDNFIYNLPIVTVAEEIQLLEDFIASIENIELIQTIKDIISDNTALILRLNESSHVPQKEELIHAYMKAWDQKTTPYIDSSSEIISDLIMDTTPEKGEIIFEDTCIIPGVKRWTLSNGANVYSIKTKNKSDQARVIAISKGGYSLFDKEDYPQCGIINSVIATSGLGNYSGNELRKILSQHQVNYRAYIEPLLEEFEGKSSLEDFETLLQLLYLRFTTFPREEKNFENLKGNYIENLELAAESPQLKISDSLLNLLYNDNPHMVSQSLDLAEKFDYERIIELFQQRFQDAHDFDFIIMSPFDDSELQTLVETYIASLPSNPNKERENYDPGAFPFPNPYDGEIRLKGNSIKCNLIHNRYLKVEYSLGNRLTAIILQEIIKDLLLKEIRESAGGTYSVNVSLDISRIPEGLLSISAACSTDKSRMQEMIESIRNFFDTLPSKELSDQFIVGLKANLRNDYLSYSQTDDFKINLLKDYLLFDTLESQDYPGILESINIEDLLDMARKIKEAPTIIDIITD